MSEKRQANIVVKHIKSEYGANPEFLWPDRYPSYAVFRHDNNKKWFALVATISSKSLGLKEDKAIDVINIWLDGTLPNGLIFELIKKSYSLSAK